MEFYRVLNLNLLVTGTCLGPVHGYFSADFCGSSLLFSFVLIVFSVYKNLLEHFAFQVFQLVLGGPLPISAFGLKLLLNLSFCVWILCGYNSQSGSPSPCLQNLEELAMTRHC